MGEPMMIRTSKACAGRVTAPKQGANGSNDSRSHQGEGEGKSLQPCRSSTAA